MATEEYKTGFPIGWDTFDAIYHVEVDWSPRRHGVREVSSFTIRLSHIPPVEGDAPIPRETIVALLGEEAVRQVEEEVGDGWLQDASEADAAAWADERMLSREEG